MKHLLYLAVALCIVGSQMMDAQSWVSLNGPQIASEVKDISVTSNGSTLYIADANYVLKSTSTGSAWAVTSQPYSNPLFVLVKPSDANVVLAAKTEFLSQSTDGGSSWSNKIEEESLTPLRLVAAMNNNAVMLLGRTYVSGNNAIWRSGTSGSTWDKVTGFTPETDIHDFACYPNSTSGWGAGLIWAGGSDPDGTPNGESNSSTASTSGLWQSTDYGVTWSADRLGNRNIRSLAIVPKTYPTDYIRLAVDNVSGGNDIVLRNASLSGDDWSNVFSSAADVYMVRLKISNNNLFLATSSGVYRSTNEGVDWSQENSGLGDDTHVLSIAPTATGDVVFAGTANSLYKSTNNGDTWTEVGKMNVASLEKSGDSLWTVSKDNAFASRTTNAGTSWSNGYIQSVSASFSSQHIYHTPGGGQLFVSGALNNAAKLYRSTNGGTSYAQITGFTPAAPTAGTFKGVVRKPGTSQEMVLFGEFTVSGVARTMFASTDDGDSWTVATPSWDQSGIAVNDVEYLDISSGRLFAMISNGAVYRSNNNGWTWSPVLSSSGAGNSLAINPNNTSVVYAARTGGLWKSTDSGSSWTQVRSDNVLRVVMPYPNSSAILYALTESSGSRRVYYTNNSGGSWSEVTEGLTASSNNLRAPFNAGLVYAATNRGIYQLDIPPTPPQGITGSNSGDHPRIDWDGNPEADIYAYNVYKSVQHCYPTEDDCYDHPSTPAFVGTTQNTYFIDAAETILPIFGPDGVFRKAWYSVKAVDQGSNLSDASATAYFLLSGGGEEEDLGKYAHDGSTQAIPTSFALSENYPNPFNPTTTIHYALPHDAHVSLTVFDVLGREVAVLVHQFETAGYRSVSFDASLLPSGVYFCRIQAGLFTSIKKMLLAK